MDTSVYRKFAILIKLPGEHEQISFPTYSIRSDLLQKIGTKSETKLHLSLLVKRIIFVVILNINQY